MGRRLENFQGWPTLATALENLSEREMTMLSKLKGKKTYIIAALAGAGAVAQALGYVIPEYVFILLGAAGFGTVRSAIGR